MKNLHVESVAKRLWAALLEQMQQALHVVEEPMPASDAYKDLCSTSDSNLSVYI
jgi:hypothetical protein